MEACLYNTRSDNVVARCKYHHCGMTVRQMKCKNCLGKNCWHFEKNEKHPYWKQREVMKQKRKNRKNAINEYIASLNF